MSATADLNGTRDASTTAHLVRLGKKHVTNGLGRLTDGIMSRGEGSYVEYEDGRRLLDFTSGIGVTSLGHCHPKVSKAAADQCLTLVHAQCSIAFHKPYLQLVERLLPMMPHPSLDSFFFWNSGSEAVEAAIKLARVATGRQHIICMQGGYHGRTFGAMAVTKSKTIYSEGVFPVMPGVFTMPYPYWHQHNLPPSTPAEVLVNQSLYQLELLLAQQTAPKDTAAIIVEPLLGEGGYVPAPPAFLHGLREVCDAHGILLIADEVQSGFARTGKYFMVEHSGVRPDIMVIAKGLANGFPLSGVVSRKPLTDHLKPGTMGGTYAGNAVSCAAAVAVADAFKEENILENVKERSHELRNSLEALRSDPDVAPYVLDVRGEGLMLAVEFTSPDTRVAGALAKADSPPGLATRVVHACIERGLLILTTSAYEVVRFIPPLNISKHDLKHGAEIFGEAVRAVLKE
ncbi:hypothetical protein H0H81_002890 [Sphagnurus paluster]|uniref:Acetylornithine aminotransferase n=1 Tax=Sphagnurus paluster TaxID=117069 RepID=A0A9P7FNX9_9AGAR|nr:hypothetical protein H0H81_002890 [Sphagnurus paluster]